MTRSEIIQGLPNTWGRPMAGDAFDAFVKRMATRQYGGEALRNAWGWFEAGYEAARATPADASEKGGTK